MIISENQIQQLILVSHLYLRVMDKLQESDESNLTACGKSNKKLVAKLLQDIAEQQGTKLKDFK